MGNQLSDQAEDPARERTFRFHRLFPWIAGLVSISAALLIAAHVIWPSWAIDSTTVALLIVVILPWILPFIRSIELPGGTKIELSELVYAGSQFLHREDRNTTPASTKQTPTYITGGISDPNLALAGLRNDLERMLSNAFAGRLARPRSNSVAIERLRRRGMLSDVEASALQRILLLLNQAVPGVVVETGAAAWALTDGPRIVASLDSRLHAIETEQRIEDKARQVFKDAGAKIFIHGSTDDFPPIVAQFGEHRIAFEAVALAEDFRLRRAADHILQLVNSGSADEGLIVSSAELAFPDQYDGIRVISITELQGYVNAMVAQEESSPVLRSG